MPAAALVLLYLAVVLAPLALAAAGLRPPRPFWDELASGAGLLAFAVILVEFVLSGRFRSVSGRIGMDVTMRLHQLLARTALVLALVHPFLYRAAFNPPYPWDPTRQLTLTADLAALGSGILAWVLLPAFVLLAIRRAKLEWRYETWRAVHGLGAVAIAGLLLHHALSAGRYSQDPLFAGLWIALFLLALASLADVYLLSPLRQRRRPWSLRRVRPVALKTWELVLEPQGHAGLDYRAGQFVWLTLGDSPFSLREHPFSLSSAPADGPRLEVLVKELGDFTGRIGALAPGTPAYVDGPHGSLVAAGRREPGIALIAGGVGLAPLLGILRQLHLEEDPRPRLLVYGNRTASQIAYRAELEALAEDPACEVVQVLSEPPADWPGRVGQLDGALIRSLFRAPQMRDWLFVLCGPPAMMAAAEETLIALGVPARQILSERFSYD